MSNIVIKVEKLSKQYRLGIINHGTLRQDLQSWWARMHGKEDPNLIISSHQSSNWLSSNERFWALKDISIDVKHGEILGIIGRNGAGKSTLLKILSRVTAPSTGTVKIKGRVASLLEVGTGFHPELTGRENIYLNGAILGMTKKEISMKFDEIVDFAEIEKFIDTPVKRYSSGMYVRLAFAVAAHLEPEILIVDEVLAVGDVKFQKKCLGKMQDVSKEGRTILFVSHNMNAVENLCSRAILLDKGSIKQQDQNVRSVINKYLFSIENNTKRGEWTNSVDDLKNIWFRPSSMYVTDVDGNKLNDVQKNDSEIWIHIEGEIKESEPALQVGYAIFSEDGNLLYWSCHTDIRDDLWPQLEKGHYIFKSQIPKRFLNEGTYRIELILALYFKQWLSEPGKNAPAIYLTIQGGLSESSYWMIKRPGLLAPVLQWHAEKINA